MEALWNSNKWMDNGQCVEILIEARILKI
jgi:hypothetical protein